MMRVIIQFLLCTSCLLLLEYSLIYHLSIFVQFTLWYSYYIEVEPKCFHSFSANDPIHLHWSLCRPHEIDLQIYHIMSCPCNWKTGCLLIPSKHWGSEEMAAILQITFSFFVCSIVTEKLFHGIQLTLSQCCLWQQATSHGLMITVITITVWNDILGVSLILMLILL